MLSHPAWGAWIEVRNGPALYGKTKSHPAWGAWIEVYIISIPWPAWGRPPHGVRELKLDLYVRK